MPSLKFFAYLGFCALPFALADATTTFKTCTTRYGTASKATIGSTTYGFTFTETATMKIKVTPTITLQPTSTLTVLDTITLPTIITEQITVTASLVVVPTSPGFTPINGGAAKRAPTPMRIEQRDSNVVKRAQAVLSKVACEPNGPVYTPAIYPSTVTCAQLVIVAKTTTLTSTAKATTITAPIPVSTVLTTIYSSTTTTMTIVVPAATSYAACASTNLELNAGIVIYTPPIPIRNTLSLTADSAYDCCVACQTTANCAAGSFYGTRCFLDLVDTCSPGTSIANVYAGGVYEAFNGPCGHYNLVA
ncbi:hypothetical protein LTR02_012334 [Friedmanniomyces endolithicus]|uniref:Apple domain-containing protein n=1 Tax=Rachicladosporium monterosium TaxID=1507873 RepID=A0ABR0L181_9PEZI|nr:hypothetical protein LTR94_013445 [Friedmanniomyces endolithicus]KAK5141926.1 hypothetical protein LTR32_005625 [Rachicladosporium monterosium]KAK0781616.1 hypothetical protein LTR59_012439 [Friedmanniomyces endolithicus]KAK0786515.1 hypothetical protein LTR38_011968 [Friedmanniomyces endolithicus]KAK0810407.1 hypothetical protein LTR75_005645 [Friedmanniomyces endolithicus]